MGAGYPALADIERDRGQIAPYPRDLSQIERPSRQLDDSTQKVHE